MPQRRLCKVSRSGNANVKGSQSLAEWCEQSTPSGGEEQLRFTSSSFGQKEVFLDVHPDTRFREKCSALSCMLTPNYLPMCAECLEPEWLWGPPEPWEAAPGGACKVEQGELQRGLNREAAAKQPQGRPRAGRKEERGLPQEG